MAMLPDLFRRDARYGQLLALGTLIAAGSVAFGFEMPVWRPATALGAALAVQFIACRVVAIPFDWRSAAITAGSLTLLLRTEGAALVALAAAIAILSKFVIRARGRHLVNPAAFGIWLTALIFSGAWVSPGQWGSGGWLLIVAAGLGTLVTSRARRAEVPLLFLAAWAALAFGRAAWLGDPLAIPLHQMQSGALVVFAFFMISDPMSQPRHPLARAGWVLVVAVTGFALQTAWIVDAGPLWGLILAAPIVPLLDHVMPAAAPRWRASLSPPLTGVSR